MIEDAEILRDLLVFNILLGCKLFLYGVFCWLPLCSRIEPVLQFRMSKVKLMKCCMFDSNCVVADAVMTVNHTSLIFFLIRILEIYEITVFLLKSLMRISTFALI